MYQTIEDRPWNLIGYWPMNEQGGITARDESYSGNNLVLWDWSWKYDLKQIAERWWPKFIVSDVPVFHKVFGCLKDIPRGPGVWDPCRCNRLTSRFLCLRLRASVQW